MTKDMEIYGTLELCGMEFHAYHGCLENEIREGNLFTVDFKAELEIGRAAGSDRLEDTVDVNEIYSVIKSEMEHRCSLLESLAVNLRTAIARKFSESFISFELRVSKHHPPLEGRCEWSRISVKWSK